MPYIKKVHKCNTPDMKRLREDEADAGSIWQCPDCDSKWELIGSMHTFSGYMWRRMEENEHDPTNLV